MVFFFGFFRAGRHPADSDGRPTAGAHVLARVSMAPWHPYQHCNGECRLALRAVNLQKRKALFL